MTYKSQWKAHVDKIWAEYKLDWDSHVDEKLDKTWFKIMNEFMKEKYAQATPEILKEVEEYRQKVKDDSGEDATNLAKQS